MKHAAMTAAAALALATPAALAATQSQVVPFDYSPLDGTIELDIQGFDTHGGSRQLNAVTFRFDHAFTLDLYVESTGPTALSSKDFGINTFFISIYQLGTVNLRGDDGPSGPPFFGPGGFDIYGASGGLAAYDGVPGNDGPDSFRQTFTEAYFTENTFSAGVEFEQEFLDAVTDVGTLTTIYGGFQELQFFWNNDPEWPLPGGDFPEYPTDAAVWVAFQNYRHSGAITITYDYTEIPAPGAAAPLAAFAALALRRRR